MDDIALYTFFTNMMPLALMHLASGSTVDMVEVEPTSE